MKSLMQRYIMVPVFGCPIDKACGHEEWTMDCSYNERAVYYTRWDEDYVDENDKKGRIVPTGVPIMFLRQHGENRAAEELVRLANR